MADYITADTIMPRFLPYPYFLLKMDLSQTAELLYSLLFDRSELSQKNGWQDNEGRTYIVYPVSEIAEMLDKGSTAIKAALNELDAAGLLERKRRETLEASHREYKHREEVERLKRKGFTDPAMRAWTFENDNSKCPQMHKAFAYVECWEKMKAANIGYLLWGMAGTGKSYFAGCIANALMEHEISVCMTNFSLILNDLTASYKDRNEYIARLCSFPLLILDDFGMERGTEYGLEQVYNVIDSRYRSGKPLIVTTNLTLEELQNPEDTAHARIYDRLTEMCTPVRITGENFRKAKAREKMEQLKTLLNRWESL